MDLIHIILILSFILLLYKKKYLYQIVYLSTFFFFFLPLDEFYDYFYYSNISINVVNSFILFSIYNNKSYESFSLKLLLLLLLTIYESFLGLNYNYYNFFYNNLFYFFNS